MNADKMATYAGGAIAVLQSTQVALGQIPPGTSMHTQDWISLATAAVFAFLGWVTNRDKAA